MSPDTSDHPYPVVLSARFREALAFAAQLHASQYRKGRPIPYISHLMAVCSLVLEQGGSEDQAIAALLHDAIEDQGGPVARRRIRELFGDEVVRLVDGCTDSDETPKPPWRQRKDAYLERLRSEEDDIRLISLADKIHNARSILWDYRQVGEEVWSRFKGGKKGTLWYYHELVKIFNEIGPFPLATELARVVRELDELVGESFA